MAPDPSGEYLASVSADATIRIWRPSTGVLVTSLRVEGPLTSVCWRVGYLLAGGDQGSYLLQFQGE
jgi:WD40 repeat protein